MPVSADRVSQFKRISRRALPVVFALAAGAAASVGSPNRVDSSSIQDPQLDTSFIGNNDEKCSFKISTVSVWLKSEPPTNLQEAGNPLWDWALQNNQISGPAGERTMDLFSEKDSKQFGTMSTDAERIGRTDSGSNLIKAEAPIQTGVRRLFQGKWRETALVRIFDRATNKNHIHELLCECIYNARVPRWMKGATPTPTLEPTPTASVEVAPPTATPTVKEVCPPTQIPLPCRTKESLFNPTQEDDGQEAEVGKLQFENQKYSMMLPQAIANNLKSQEAVRP